MRPVISVARCGAGYLRRGHSLPGECLRSLRSSSGTAALAHRDLPIGDAEHEAQARPRGVDGRDLVVDQAGVEPDLLHRVERRGRWRRPTSASATPPTARRRARARARTTGSAARSSARRVTKNTMTSSRPRACVRSCAPAGSAPSDASNPWGADTTATREPSRMPNFFGSGVPEYPLLIVAMPSCTLPPPPVREAGSSRRAAACQPVPRARRAGTNISDRFTRLLTIRSVV